MCVWERIVYKGQGCSTTRLLSDYRGNEWTTARKNKTSSLAFISCIYLFTGFPQFVIIQEVDLGINTYYVVWSAILLVEPAHYQDLRSNMYGWPVTTHLHFQSEFSPGSARDICSLCLHFLWSFEDNPIICNCVLVKREGEGESRSYNVCVLHSSSLTTAYVAD